MIRSLVGIVFLGLLVSCDKELRFPAETGYDFYPLEEGNFREFVVTETRYALARPPEITTYHLRETIGEKYTDANDQDVYRIERAILQGNHWQVDSIWIAWRTPDRVFRAENGLTFVKLIFPIRNNTSWDGNLFNSLGEQLYRMTRLDSAVVVDEEAFDKTVTVVQEYSSTLLSLRKTQEVYAKGIGLVGWERTSVNYCGTGDCIGKNIIDYGFSQKSIITTYGK